MKRYILILAATLIAAACSDLEVNENVYHSKEYMFADFGMVKDVMTNAYGYLETG